MNAQTLPLPRITRNDPNTTATITTAARNTIWPLPRMIPKAPPVFVEYVRCST